MLGETRDGSVEVRGVYLGFFRDLWVYQGPIFVFGDFLIAG